MSETCRKCSVLRSDRMLSEQTESETGPGLGWMSPERRKNAAKIGWRVETRERGGVAKNDTGMEFRQWYCWHAVWKDGCVPRGDER